MMLATGRKWRALGHWCAYLEQQHPLFDAEAAPALTADNERLLRQAWQSIYSTAFALDGIQAFYEDWYRFDPSRSQRSLHVRSFLLSFGAETSLYDHSTRLVSLMGRNSDAVKFIDALQDEMIPQNSFSRFREQLQGSQDRARIMAGTQYLHWLEHGLRVRDEAQGWNCERLWNELEIRLASIEQQGVLLNTFTQASGDYLVALRPRLNKVAKAQAIIKAFSHLDKPYDFYFDFATDHALVCTELLWRSYRPAQGKKGLDIDLVEIAGRHTLPANEIARLFVTEYNQPDRQLDFVLFYDADEEKGSSFESTEQEFIKSVERLKWSFLQQ